MTVSFIKNDFIYDLIRILTDFEASVLLRKEHMYVLKEIEIPSLLTVLLLMPFNHLPFCAF